MRQELFDTLTRAFAMPTQRSGWRVLASTAATSFWALVGQSITSPQSAIAATSVDSNCIVLNHDATCPSGTNKHQQSGYTPSFNGCGPEGGTIKLPQGYGKADYTSSCNHHDTCYEECDTPKVSCDETFRDDMYASCAAAYPGLTNSLSRFGCYERAYAYYAAVLNFGDSAWIAAQQKSCECCSDAPNKLWCNCSKTCYDDINSCLDECKATLGCFSGICTAATSEQCPV